MFQIQSRVSDWGFTVFLYGSNFGNLWSLLLMLFLMLYLGRINNVYVCFKHKFGFLIGELFFG